MGEKERDEERRAESRRILKRVERDSDTLFLGAASTARDHFTAREAEDADWTERWGRRIGRVLGLGFAVFLIIWLWRFLTGTP
ncbi:hypothetical protein [Chelativorans sp. M5D2P16]|uniref:hypothetical protein n=1 Tax=Chelativorans sp. M5D2P16 TaxID=3095678 RepID=UPI002ACAE969|nr:hypothetical protein [Chelativorans sp. M5D2P16]MDZ5699276.1 hypothetical protein [Chelativorans sp. M5D2P16]